MRQLVKVEKELEKTTTKVNQVSLGEILRYFSFEVKL